MILHFIKMHGIGNDYVYVDGFKQTVEHPEKIAPFISDRHKGIGGDGLILILPSKIADCRMRMFNADGSEGKMCGNGVRCVGKFVYDNGYAVKNPVTVETLSGIKTLKFTLKDSKVDLVEVDMGKAILKTTDIPVKCDSDTCINQPLEVDGKIYHITAVSMGNPHAVVFVQNTDELEIEKIGPKFEFHPAFPDRVNTEFVQPVDDHTIKMRVWERGSGETQACGTGACASVVACVENGLFPKNKEITVKLLGGDLYITYLDNGTVIMKGSATKVFEGDIDI